ncbi:hypothetical protein HU745_08115 [Pseudomonas mosselii]|uniref:hypothetical protein n=1 Tax=Pseudomonas mosselii TaxID=78327 RepID=UPI0016497993|nr:hypothetical protein [Pseudomonas mosselii]MBC3451015.1 hypothetical protein [Pseudomonas mosselii]
MDQDMLRAVEILSRNENRLTGMIQELASMFPGVANGLAWKETIWLEQRNWRKGPKDPYDYQLDIGAAWLKLAREGRLHAEMTHTGLAITELDADPLAPKDLEEILFKLLDGLNGGWLMYHDLFVAVDQYLGLSLGQHKAVLVAVLEELSSKRYLRADVSQKQQLRVCKGLRFDEWRTTMDKPASPSVTNNSFNFNAKVGAVQTGAGSVANVHQASTESAFADLKAALEALLQDLKSADMAPTKRQEAADYIDKTIHEIDSEKPNKGMITALCSGLATTVQTLGSASAAYGLVTAAFAKLGVSL